MSNIWLTLKKKTCRSFCIINEICRRESVSVYSDDEMISSKASLNVSAIRRLQKMHQGKAAQNDQDNQQENDEEFN